MIAIIGIQLCVHKPNSAYAPATFSPVEGFAMTTNITMGVDAMKMKNNTSMNFGAVALTSMDCCESDLAHSNSPVAALISMELSTGDCALYFNELAMEYVRTLDNARVSRLEFAFDTLLMSSSDVFQSVSCPAVASAIDL